MNKKGLKIVLLFFWGGGRLYCSLKVFSAYATHPSTYPPIPLHIAIHPVLSQQSLLATIPLLATYPFLSNTSLSKPPIPLLTNPLLSNPSLSHLCTYPST
jgi:hypothetical protein